MKTAVYPGTFDPVTYGHLAFYTILQKVRCFLWKNVLIY